MLMDRERAADLGRETVEILKAGCYTTAAGHVVQIGELVRRAVAGTVPYPPNRACAIPALSKSATRIEVANETTLVAARRLIAAGYRPAALNFASARHPGGGFLTGARAQEESLARSSGLYACLVGNAMYALHQARRDAMYTDYVIYSPDVPVFRDDDGNLLSEPYLCSFINCPAVNAKVVLDREPTRKAEILRVMWARMLKVLAVAATHGHQALVLGAWGCGAFGNDSREIARLFQRALAEDFRDAFARAVFAVTDWSPERRFIGPFCEVFGVADTTA